MSTARGRAGLCIVLLCACGLTASCGERQTGRTPEPPPLTALGVVIGTIGEADDSASLLWSPTSMAFRPSGDILVTDRDMRVRVFSVDGALLLSMGRTGSGPGEFRELMWAASVRGDSVLAWDHQQARATLFAPDGTFARQVQYSPTAAVYFASTASQRLAGFPLPVQREHADSEWGRTPLISRHMVDDVVARVDTLDVPVWLRCEPATRDACRPLADTLRARRGTLAVAGDFVYAIPANAPAVMRYHTLEPGAADTLAVLPDVYAGHRVHTLVAGSAGEVWVGVRGTGDAVEDHWLRMVPGIGVERAVLLPSTERVVAAQAECVVVRSGVTLRIHLLDEAVRSAVPCSATDSQHDAFSAAAGAASAAQSGDSAEASWSLTRLWRVGTVDGPEILAFHSITSVATDRQGNVHVLDFGSQHIKVFDASGTYVRTIGRQGRGPGEFDGPLALAWDTHDRLWVPDGWNRRYTVFDRDGAVVKTVPRRITSMTGFRQRMHFVSDDTFVDEMSVTIDGQSHTRLLLVDTTGAVIDSFAPLPRVSAFAGSIPEIALVRASPGLRQLRDYLPHRVHAVTHDGRTVWIARSDSLRLFQIGRSGDTLRVIQSRHRDRALTRQERRQLAEALSASGLDPADVQLHPRIVDAILPLEDGHVLVQIAPAREDGATEFDVYDPAGRLVASLRSPDRLHEHTNAHVRGSTLVGVTRDGMNVQYVVRMRLDRPRAAHTRQ